MTASIPDQLEDSSIELGTNVQDLPGFATVMRGYDRGQVEDYVTRLQAFLADAESRAGAAERREVQLNRKLEDRERDFQRAIERASSTAASYDGLGERVSKILGLAAEEADEIRRLARAEASELLDEARRVRDEESEAAQRSLHEMSRRRDDVVVELTRVRDALSTLGLSVSASDDGETTIILRSDAGAA